MQEQPATIRSTIEAFVQSLREAKKIPADTAMEKWFGDGAVEYAGQMYPEKIYVLLDNGTWGTIELELPKIEVAQGTIQ